LSLCTISKVVERYLHTSISENRSYICTLAVDPNARILLGKCLFAPVKSENKSDTWGFCKSMILLNSRILALYHLSLCTISKVVERYLHTSISENRSYICTKSDTWGFCKSMILLNSRP
jgi:hypothetical protein